MEIGSSTKGRWRTVKGRWRTVSSILSSTVSSTVNSSRDRPCLQWCQRRSTTEWWQSFIARRKSSKAQKASYGPLWREESSTLGEVTASGGGSVVWAGAGGGSGGGSLSTRGGGSVL